MKNKEKDLELEAAFQDAVSDLEKRLQKLGKISASEIRLAEMFSDDSHIPSDAIARLEKELQS